VSADLTRDEQEGVRRALRGLRARYGTWALVAGALRYDRKSVRRAMAGLDVTASLAVRVARAAGVGVDDVLAGRYPATGVCPKCGHVPMSHEGPGSE